MFKIFIFLILIHILWFCSSSTEGDDNEIKDKIAFVADSNIYMSNIDGSKPINITKNKAMYGVLQSSPNNNNLIFRSNFESTISYNTDIFSMDLDTYSITNLSNSPNSSDAGPKISNNGKFVIFYSNRTGNSQLFKVNIDGTELVALTPPGLKLGSFNISPNDSLVVFTSRIDTFSSYTTNIFIIDINGENLSNLTPNIEHLSENPVFPNDNTNIYFSHALYYGNWALLRMNPDGSEIDTILNYSNDFEGFGGMKFSFNSNKIIYLGGDSRDLYIINKDGSAFFQLTNEPGFVNYFETSKIDNRIIFAMNDKLNRYIYLGDFESLTYHKIETSFEFNAYPVFLY